VVDRRHCWCGHERGVELCRQLDLHLARTVKNSHRNPLAGAIHCQHDRGNALDVLVACSRLECEVGSEQPDEI
jgi:hypothetical protein